MTVLRYFARNFRRDPTMWYSLCFILVFQLTNGEEIDSLKNETVSEEAPRTNTTVELQRITQPSAQSQQVERALNTSKSDFRPSPQLETYYEFNKVPVAPALPEAKHLTQYNFGESPNSWTTEHPWTTQVKFPTTGVPTSKDRPYAFYNEKGSTGKSYSLPTTNGYVQKPLNNLPTVDDWNQFVANYQKPNFAATLTTEKAPYYGGSKTNFDFKVGATAYGVGSPQNNFDFTTKSHGGGSPLNFDQPPPKPVYGGGIPQNSFDFTATVPTKQYGAGSPLNFDQPPPKPVYGVGNPQKTNFDPVNTEVQKTNFEVVEKSPHDIEGTPWKKIIKFLTAFIPIGLLISALTPTVITVSSVNDTQSRYRADSSGNHPSNIIHSLSHFNKLGCEDRILCELLLSATNTNNAEQHIENLLDTFTNNGKAVEKAEEMKRIFRAVKNQDCKPITCPDVKENT